MEAHRERRGAVAIGEWTLDLLTFIFRKPLPAAFSYKHPVSVCDADFPRISERFTNALQRLALGGRDFGLMAPGQALVAAGLS